MGLPKTRWIVEVLRYRPKKISNSTVRRHYEKWRLERGLPDQCDNSDCDFHMHPLVWNGKPLLPILDHKNGNNRDNRPDNLQYLCPNCDSQRSTRGGANRGRLAEATDNRFILKGQDGHLETCLLPEPARLQFCDYAPSVKVTPGATQ
jgi:hypothetical protein